MVTIYHTVQIKVEVSGQCITILSDRLVQTAELNHCVIKLCHFMSVYCVFYVSVLWWSGGSIYPVDK